MEKDILITKIKELIAKNRTKSALLILEKTVNDNDILNKIILLSGKFENLQSKTKAGLLSNENATLEYNQINFAIIQLTDEITLPDNFTIPEITEEKPFTLKKKNNKPIYLTFAGISVVVIIAYLLINSLSSTFDFTVFVKTAPELNKSILEIKDNTKKLQISKGFIIIDFNGDRRKIQINDNAEANFKVIAAKFKGKSFKIELLSDYFKLVNPDSLYTVQADKPLYLEVTLSGLDKVFGTVTDTQGNPLKGVKIYIDQLNTLTDEFGAFTLQIPPANQKQEQAFKAIADGYVIYETFVYPETLQEIKIQLEKKSK